MERTKRNVGSGTAVLVLGTLLCAAAPSDAQTPAAERDERSLGAQSEGRKGEGDAELGIRRVAPPQTGPPNLHGPEGDAGPAQPGDRRLPGTGVSPKQPSLATPGAHGRNPDQANLVVELIVPASHPEGLPGTGFCAEAPPSGGPSQQVRFRARNAGTKASEPSKTAVHWTGPNGFAWMNLVDTPAVQPGGASNTYVNLPPGCFGLAAHGSCQFLVELDRTDAVAESNEADNHRSGVCIKAGT